jgi:hypothetical protein
MEFHEHLKHLGNRLQDRDKFFLGKVRIGPRRGPEKSLFLSMGKEVGPCNSSKEGLVPLIKGFPQVSYQIDLAQSLPYSFFSTVVDEMIAIEKHMIFVYIALDPILSPVFRGIAVETHHRLCLSSVHILSE